MELIKGIKTDRQIEEGYTILSDKVRANVSSEKMMKVILAFLEMNQSGTFDFAINVSLEHYHLSGMYKAMLEAMFDHMEEVLVHDGLSSFTITASNGDTITKDIYNEMSMTSTKTPKIYKKILEKQNIKKNDDLTFLKDLGEDIESTRFVLEDGTDIYAVVGALKMLGMTTDK